MRFLHYRQRAEEGLVLYWIAAMIVIFLMFAGLAIDLGRGYLVKAQLSKAVDGAALAAGRALGSGASVVPKTEAQQIFAANFPSGYMGVDSVTDPYSDPNFYSYYFDAAKAVGIFTVKGSAVLPTTFMRIAGFKQINVSSTGQATRKLVDLSLALDISGSISSAWTEVSSAAADFVDSFDENNDRMALIFYSDGGDVKDQMRTTARGFDKTTIKSHIMSQTAVGSTAMAEGFYRAWDELETVPAAYQSGMRVLVLFTDGCANGVPANYKITGNSASIANTEGILATNDAGNGMFGPTDPILPFSHLSGYNSGGGFSFTNYNGHYLGGLQYMPKQTINGGGATGHSRSGIIPTTFPMQSHTVMVEGNPQDTVRGLDPVGGDTTRWEANPRNVNNAARNLVEMMAVNARASHAGNTIAPYPIRIYTIGMGPSLTNSSLGWRPERGDDMLKRVANDPSSSDHISGQLDGRYFYAPNAASVHSAFAELKSELLRLSQ